MKTVIIANPRAAAGRVQRQWQDLNRTITAAFGPAEVHFTECKGDATGLCRRAIHEGAERIVAVGGDGTLNEIVNGFYDTDVAGTCIGAHTRLVLLPCGTGGDFAKSVGYVGKVWHKAELTEHIIDVGRALLTDGAGQTQRRHFINISSFGVSGVVVNNVENTSKRLGGTVAFALGTLRALWSYRNQPVRLTVDGKVIAEKIVINTVAIANGRSFGGGMRIAPNALLNDGLFDVVIVGDTGRGSFLRDGYKLYRGSHVSLPFVQVHQGKSVIAEPCGNTPVLIDMDGEQPGQLPVRYDILPAQLRVCAPWGESSALGPERGHDRSTHAGHP